MSAAMHSTGTIQFGSRMSIGVAKAMPPVKASVDGGASLPSCPTHGNELAIIAKIVSAKMSF